MAPFGTKRAIHAAYIEGLKQTYPWARDGGVAQERGLALAAQAADKALAGKLKLEGRIWFEALAQNGVQKSSSMKILAGLPA